MQNVTHAQFLNICMLPLVAVSAGECQMTHQPCLLGLPRKSVCSPVLNASGKLWEKNGFLLTVAVTLVL